MKTKFIILLHVLSLLLPPAIYSQESKTNSANELVGVDKNENNVRDDIEEFIKKNLSKGDRKIEKAFLNFAETITLIMLNKDNKEKLQQLEIQQYNDHICLMSVEPEGSISRRPMELINKIVNTEKRNKAFKDAMYATPRNAIKSPDKKDWNSLCRK